MKVQIPKQTNVSYKTGVITMLELLKKRETMTFVLGVIVGLVSQFLGVSPSVLMQDVSKTVDVAPVVSSAE